MLKIGVLGAGHLGKIHIKLIKEVQDFELVGFYDPDDQNSLEAISKYDVRRFEDIDELIDNVDVIDIVTPTLSHYECAVKAIKKQRHVFIEKPITNTVAEAKELVHLAHEAKVKVQVGHVERFNPAFVAARPYFDHPMFIETHRLAQFNPRGTDVSVVLDLMIHDIDIILSVVKSTIKKISASGVAVVSDSPDLANARIEFDNGCVANLTASRLSIKNMRKSRFFQRNAYLTVDFLEKSVNIFKIKDVKGEPDPLAMILDLGDVKGKKEIYFDLPDIKETNAIQEELSQFATSIINDLEPPVTVDDGCNALTVAHQIVDKLVMTSSLIE